ncbi:MAG: rod shape-determining protein MreC [Anaerolineales bacterium]
MSRSRSRALFALMLALVAAASIFLSLGGYLDFTEGLILRPLASIQGWFASRFAAIRDLISSPRDVASLRARIAELEAENALLEQQVISLREQVTETDILAALLDFARTQPESRYLAGPVIGRDVSPFLRSVWIGVGSDDGVGRGMPVVTNQGLVGRVMEVFATVSRVQLITDPQAAVNVRFQDSRADGILVAQLSGELHIEMISQEKTISPDELVLTSGLGGTYPADIPVGQVLSVRKRDYEIFQDATIQPAVDFFDLEIVLVITSFRPLPIDENNP